jgi:hypothetical protein
LFERGHGTPALLMKPMTVDTMITTAKSRRRARRRSEDGECFSAALRAARNLFGRRSAVSHFHQRQAPFGAMAARADRSRSLITSPTSQIEHIGVQKIDELAATKRGSLADPGIARSMRSLAS